jgi:hypothetical protein
MHLRHDKPMNALIFMAGLVLLGTLLMLTFVDVHSRLPVHPATSPYVVPSNRT